MSPLIKDLEDKVAKYETYIKDATKRNKNFIDFSLEIEGYMASFAGFVFGYEGMRRDMGSE